MSQTLTIDAMIAQLQQRIPMGLTNPFCTQELNKAWRWVEQQGAMSWNIRTVANLAVAAGATTATGVPSDLDIGKPASIYPNLSGNPAFQYEIVYMPFEEWVLQLDFHFTPPPGMFSAWTYVSSGSTPTYAINFAPASATPSGGGNTYTMYYHHMVGPQLVSGGGAFFPTPDEFDDTLIDLAEGEIKRIYNLFMWEAAQKKAENSAMKLLDKYRSPRRNLAGVTEKTLEVQEESLRKSDASV